MFPDNTKPTYRPRAAAILAGIFMWLVIFAVICLALSFSWANAATMPDPSNSDPGGGGLWWVGPYINQRCPGEWTYIACYDPECQYPTQPLQFYCSRWL